METTVKCNKCGRVLKSPLSIAMGMGPKCAGVSIVAGKKLNIGIRRNSGKRYNAVGAGSAHMPLTLSQISEKKLPRREQARRNREDRRRLFDERRSFQCGTLVRSKTPLVYEPVGEKDWKDKVSGNILSQEQLQAYLIRSQLI